MAIWLYTAEHWGVDQADTYTSNIDAKLANLALHPSRGTGRSDLYHGLRKATVGAHCVYYLFDNTMIDVVRILHQRQDAVSALRP